MADQDEINNPQLTNKTSKPAGIIPKNAQTWVMIGVAALIMGVILFSGSPQPKTKAKPELPGRTTYATDANQRRIEEYKREVDEDTRRLELQKERERAQADLAAAAGQNSSLNGEPGQPGYASGQAYPPGYSSHYGSQQQSPEEMQRQAIENEKRKREYASLFASNVVLSFRKESSQGQGSAAQTLPSTQGSSRDQTQNPVLAQLEERERGLQERAAQAQQQAEAAYGAALAAYSQQTKDNGVLPNLALRQVAGEGAGYPSQANAAAVNPNPTGGKNELAEKRAKQADDSQLQQAQGKKYRLFEGTVVEGVLTNRLDGAFSGPVNVMVTTNVYSHDHDRLLIPQGSRLLGEAQSVNAFGQNRLAVAFHRLIMPDGYSLSLDQFQGLNQIGETGLKDKVNHHYVQIFGTAIAIGLVAGIAQANTTYGYNTTGTDEMRQGFAQSLSGTSLQILNRFLNILPTVTIREGNRIKVLLTDDLFLPAYDNHTIPSNL